VVSGLEASTKLIIGKSNNVAGRMMEISRRYASRIPAMMEIEGKSSPIHPREIDERFKDYGDDGYPPMCAEFHASNGRVLRPLNFGSLLNTESARLGHCVSSYKSTARRLYSHILSFQNEDGTESYSTVEFRGITGDDPAAAAAALSQVQHRAHQNAHPDALCLEACEEFKREVKSGRWEINLAEMNTWRDYLKKTEGNEKRHSSGRTGWKSALEFNWEKEDMRLAYWQEWGQVLGGKIEKANNPGMVYSEKKAQELVSAMSPRTAAILVDQAREAAERRKAAQLETPEP
jgi:hypothetical protein